MVKQPNSQMKTFIDSIMPDIDDILTKNNIPIFNRFMMAATFFVENYVQDSSVGSNKELLKHEAFFKNIVPLFMQWYYERYGELAKPPYEQNASGIAINYPQPIKLVIPLSISTPTDKGTCWLKFPDKADDSENISSFIGSHINIDFLELNKKSDLTKEIFGIVSLTRGININLMSISGLDPETTAMMASIWSHFEKAIDDIISFRDERISLGCWELHLAIEKSFKVLIKQKMNKKAFGHNLLELYETVKEHCHKINRSLLESLPSDKEAIKMRYAEKNIPMNIAIKHYKVALEIVFILTESLDRKLKLNNAAFEIKQAPWAI